MLSTTFLTLHWSCAKPPLSIFTVVVKSQHFIKKKPTNCRFSRLLDYFSYHFVAPFYLQSWGQEKKSVSLLTIAADCKAKLLRVMSPNRSQTTVIEAVHTDLDNISFELSQFHRNSHLPLLIYWLLYCLFCHLFYAMPSQSAAGRSEEGRWLVRQ